jgi:prepilin-type N-terminal cleavage/methylation domain-containing protein
MSLQTSRDKSFARRQGFTPLETIGQRKKSTWMSLVGFTLIEVLIALFIIALGLIFLYNLFIMGWQSLALGRKLNEVSLLSQKKLEELKSQTLQEGQLSGKENDLDWQIYLKPLKFPDGVEVIFCQMDVTFLQQGISHKERFITYFSAERQ